MNIRWILLTLLVSWVATCGQKGPLQLPETKLPGAAAPVLAQLNAVPA